ncbi:MAG TPA: DUF1648 domain-containing protein [Candidatus Competibacteraceae bacterium]|nr:DUF1648 domain-containing protein [Candidatus Competibacteraceae bacterium]
MKGLLLLGTVIIGAVIYILKDSATLPATMATHFGSGGMPNGYMSRDGYIAFMVALVVVIPALVGLGGRLVRWLPAHMVNLPNKDYWLAPERRAQTTAWVESSTIVYAVFLVLFFCFIHSLVATANGSVPVRLPERPFFIGTFVFVAATVFLLVAFYIRFRRRP